MWGGATGFRTYVFTLGAVAIALAVAAVLRPVAGLENVDLILLVAVVAVAATYGILASIVAAFASVLAYNFVFIPPIFTFEVADQRNVITLVLFLIVALITGNLAARVRAEALAASLQAQTTEALYEFSRSVTDLRGQDELATIAVSRLGNLLNRDVLLLLPDTEGVLQVQAASSSDDMVEDIEFGALQASWTAGEWAGRDALRLGPRLYYPLRTGLEPTGVLGLSRDGMREPLSPDEESMFSALTGQIAGALHRIRLAHERDQARMAAEGERLRTALLNSISHDLRTPLASITGAVTALRQDPELYDAAARDELTATIQDEAERMMRFVTNLLDMTRLEAGGIVLAREPVDVGEVIATALQRSARVLSHHKVAITAGSDLPLLHLDAVLLEQAIVNLLDNAAKYAPAGSRVLLDSRQNDDGVTIRVEDEGSGLPKGGIERVFDPFYRVERGDRQQAGTGLGLAVCRGFVEALGGTITAANRSDRSGAIVTILFPHSLAVEPEDVAE